MKRKSVDDTELVTRGILKDELQRELRELRSDIFTKLDQIVGTLDQMREDHLFLAHDVRNLEETTTDHERRLTKLEPSSGS